MKEFWRFSKADDQDDDAYLITGEACYKCFECELWFELGKSICKKNHSVFKDHVRYILNNIQKPYKARIFHYDERLREVFKLDSDVSSSKFSSVSSLSPPSCLTTRREGGRSDAGFRDDGVAAHS